MHELMKIAEVADLLRLSKDTVYRMARAGDLPASRVGAQWRFQKNDIQHWLEQNKNTAGRELVRDPTGAKVYEKGALS